MKRATCMMRPDDIDDSCTRLRSPPAQRSSLRRSNLRRTPIRSAVVRTSAGCACGTPYMRHSTKLELIRDGRVAHSETVTKSDGHQVEIADTTGIADFSKLQTRPADACIYCGSTAQPSREHILPYALGGT